MKKRIALLLGLVLVITALAGCSNAEGSQEGEFTPGENGVVKVYNWGDYIDESVIDMFEAETGIEVVYDMFENNEEMYPHCSQTCRTQLQCLSALKRKRT